jgi:hypothetical protein
VIDFGAELYLPWRLLEGDLLYAEIAYRNGPLSPWLNALWFRLFGVGVDTLVVCNLALVALLCAIAWRLLAPTGRLAQTAGTLALLVAFAFAHYARIANYNYVTPYQHAQTHGLVFGFAELAALCAALRSGALGAWAAAGVCLGLTFLTKAELFVPAAAAAGVALLLARGGSRRSRVVFGAAALAPPLVAFALLAGSLPATVAFDGVLGNWRYLDKGLLGDPFYRKGSGFDDPLSSALRAGRSLGWLALALAAFLALDRALARFQGRRPLAVGLGLALFAACAWSGVPWFEAARALPATSALAALVLGALWWRARDEERRARLVPLLLLAVYSLALLGKMILAARFGHYGFVLAMPATLLLVALLVGGIPALGRSFGGGALARALGAALVAAALVGLWRQSEAHYARKDFSLCAGRDAIVVERARGAAVAEALGALEELMPANATLLVLPEGLSLNYWLRRRNPSRYWLFLPAEFEASGGEVVMLDDVVAHPPDFVALVDRPHREFGVGPFGRDQRNGARIMEFVRAGYEVVRQIGAEPFADRGFGISLLRRRAAGARE